jgi:hypothetical protein
MLTSDETQHLQNKLDLNEQLLWAGKPIPRAFSKSTIAAMIFGIPWCAITSVVGGAFLSSVIFGDPNDPVTINGTKTTISEVSILFKVGMCAFFVPFIAIGISMLFAPLWKFIAMTGQTYAVTTKRALIMGRIRTKSWRAPEISFIDRCDRRNGTGDILFSYSSVSQNGHHPPIGFDNLPANDLDAAEAALRKIYTND